MVEACEGHVRGFLAGSDRRLMNESETTGYGRQQLHQCYLQAGRLFTRLHGQTLELRRHHAELLGRPYDARFMQLDSRHASMDDGDDDLWEGKGVVLVVSPLLMKITRRDEEVFRHVLVKAVVWVDV